MLAARPSIASRQRILCYVLLFLVAAGLVLSGSVGSLLAVAGATFVWLALQRSSAHSILVFIAIGLCVIGVVTVQAKRGASTPLERIGQVTRVNERAETRAHSISASRHIESSRSTSNAILSSA